MNKYKYDPNKSKKKKHRIDLCLSKEEYEVLKEVIKLTGIEIKKQVILISLELALKILKKGEKNEQKSI